MPAAKVGEAANDAEDFTEDVGALPGDGEGCDGAGTGAAYAVPLWIVRDVEVLAERRQQFLDDDARVTVVERVVLGWPVGVAVGDMVGSPPGGTLPYSMAVTNGRISSGFLPIR